jgi:DNA-binding transcriptional regulator/RsmH inhibitor MraZ
LKHALKTELKKFLQAIDSLNPFEEKRDFFATSILAESTNLQFDSEGRISLSSKLLEHAKIKIACYLLDKVKPSKFGSQQHLKNLR